MTTTTAIVYPTQKMSRRRGCLYHLLTLGIGLSLACLLAEGAAQILLNRLIEDSGETVTPGATLFEPDDELGWKHIPNAEVRVSSMPGQAPHIARINAQGLYDIDYPYEHPAEGFRVLVLGDSFTEQTHIPLHSRSFQIVEDRIQQKWRDVSYQIIEMGVARYSPAQYYRIYRREGRQYDADAVIVMLYIGNDVDELVPGTGYEIIRGIDEQTLYYTLEDGELVTVSSQSWHPPSGSSHVAAQTPITRQLDDFLNKKSVLYKWALRPFLDWHTLATLHFLDGDMPYGRMFQEGYADPVYAQTLPLLEAILLALQSDVDADGAQFAVVVAPHMYAVQEEWYFQDYPDVPRERFDPYELETRVIDILDKHGITHFSLTPALRAAADSGDTLYYRQNLHWNLEGNQVAANALETWLNEMGWIPQE